MKFQHYGYRQAIIKCTTLGIPLEATRTHSRTHSRTGRPLGDQKWQGKIEALAGRSLRKMKPGPKPKAKGSLDGN